MSDSRDWFTHHVDALVHATLSYIHRHRKDCRAAAQHALNASQSELQAARSANGAIRTLLAVDAAILALQGGDIGAATNIIAEFEPNAHESFAAAFQYLRQDIQKLTKHSKKRRRRLWR